MSCSVKGCKNVKRFKPEGIHFHRFPTGRSLRAWKNALQLPENWQYSANKFVCSKHFKDSDYLWMRGSQVMLKASAVPFVEDVAKSPRSESCEMSVANPSTSTDNVGVSILDTSISTAASSSKEISQTSSLQSSIAQTSSIDSSASGTSLNRPISQVHLKRKMTSEVMKRKIKLEKLHGTDTSTGSTDSSTKRKRSARWIQFMHTYSTSPRKMKKKYTLLKESQSKTRRQLYTAKRTIKTLNRKITNLKVVVEDLKQNQSLSEGAAFHLEKCYEDVPNILMRRYLKNISKDATTKEKYPEKIRNFAATLQFYSSKAYEYVSRTFALALPHQCSAQMV